MFENSIKSISVADLENAVAKVITEMAGEELEATISGITYDPNEMTNATFTVRLTLPLFVKPIEGASSPSET